MDGIDIYPEGFWDRVRAARHRLLALDYDGTLAPFRANRMEAVPLEGIPALLDRLPGLPAARAALVSGRPISELTALAGHRPLIMSGSHGWEWRDPDGTVRTFDLNREQARGLDQAYDAARSAGWDRLLERKAASVALHTRPLPASEAAAAEDQLEALWEPRCAGFGLECRRFNGGVELRARGRDKGTILDALVRDLPHGAVPVYLGDDDTDEDAFRAIARGGYGFKVGLGETAAAGRLKDIEAVREFLRRWIEVLSGGL